MGVSKGHCYKRVGIPEPLKRRPEPVRGFGRVASK